MNLFEYQDLKYKEFNDKIVNQDVYPTIGIRIPTLRKLAQETAKNGYLDYINSKHTYYEEYLIHGLVIGYAKIPFKDKLNLLDKYVPTIHDWASVDIPVSNLKDFKKNQSEGFEYILKLLKGNEWSIRFGLVLLLDYYINDQYIDKVLDISLNIKNDSYYVVMARAWLLATIYIKYSDKVYKLLKEKSLPKDVHNKIISKICESYRVSDNLKDKVRKEKIK